MKSLRLLPLSGSFVCLALLFVACPPAAEETVVDTSADEAAVEQIGVDYSTYWNSGDIAGIVSLYTEDGELMPSDAPTVRGHEALGEGQPIGTLSVVFDDIRVAGDWAVAEGTYMTTGTGPDGEPFEIDGRFMSINVKQADGSWKIHRNINSNTHPPIVFGTAEGDEE